MINHKKLELYTWYGSVSHIKKLSTIPISLTFDIVQKGNEIIEDEINSLFGKFESKNIHKSRWGHMIELTFFLKYKAKKAHMPIIDRKKNPFSWKIIETTFEE